MQNLYKDLIQELAKNEKFLMRKLTEDILKMKK